MNNQELDIEKERYLPREIKLIVIHCSATRCDVPFTPAQLETAHRARGFRGIGYHFYITRDGAVYHTRPLHQPGAHAYGFNLHSIGICYEGGLSPEGVPTDTRTTFQRAALLELIKTLKEQFPGTAVKGHYQLSASIHKACPCFDAEKEYGKVMGEEEKR